MCCLFTCCGWMVDVIQRAWTFSMSCLIASSVVSVMSISSLSGIALGYNYSLAEYIDLKETNVSVYLKRGVFDDQIADDMEWRRAGHLPVAGHLKDDNLITGAPADEGESTTLRSGRRLDDSVFEAEDQHHFEGSLMKLTAKPVHQETTPPQITADLEMAETKDKYPKGSLDQLKAIQSLIDSRRAMATGGTTLSPLATYASLGPLLPYLPSINNPNVQMSPEAQYRRMMAPGSNIGRLNMDSGSATSQYMPEINPARLAVPDQESLVNQIDWIAPKLPGLYAGRPMPEFFRSSPTYPPPITVRPVTVRPTVKKISNTWGSVIFPYFSGPKEASSIDLPSMQPPLQAELEQMDKEPDLYNEKILQGNEGMSRNDDVPRMGMKSPEEEYEDEIKGLPVRKRRSIIVSTLVGRGKNPTERNIIQPVGNKSTRNNNNLRSVKKLFTTTIQTTRNDMDTKYESNLTIGKNQSVVEDINDSQIGTKISNKDNTNQQMDIKVKRKSNLVKQVGIIRKRDPCEDKKEKSLLDRLVTFLGSKEASQAAETTAEANVTKSTANKIRIKIRRKSFESKIVSRKYVPNNTTIEVEKKQPFSNREILNSISVGLNEAGLLRNPTSTFVKLLQTTLTA